MSLFAMRDRRTEADYHKQVMERYIPALLFLLQGKGHQYAPDQKPALVNFYEGAKLAEDTPEHYLMSLATKQWFVLCDWSKEPDTNKRFLQAHKREIVQRLFDIIVYMLLLLFMLEVLDNQELPGEGKEGGQ